MKDTKKKLPEFKDEQGKEILGNGGFDRVSRLAIGKAQKAYSPQTVSKDDSMIEDLKIQANRRDVPYQSLPKVFLAERLAHERQTGA
jgi:hypothetical protein